MRDRLAAGDRVQLHINKAKKKAYIRNGLDWIKRFPVGRSAAFCPGRVTFETCRPLVAMSVVGEDRKCSAHGRNDATDPLHDLDGSYPRPSRPL
jgi:hypothetical protein